MPTYEYKCLNCGQQFEVFQSMKDDPLETCEKCEGRLKRLIGAGAGIIFKGAGFYCTDYRSPTYKQAASQEPSTATATGGDKGKAVAKSTGKTEGGKS